MPRPIHAIVYPCAIAHNLKIAQTHAPNSFIWGVIKANAYGHGIERIFSGLNTADGLAMLDFDEAYRVRALGWTKPILMLEGFFDKDDLKTCIDLDLTPMIHHSFQLDLLNAAPIKKALNVHIKLNSGMNRLGFNLNLDLKSTQTLLSLVSHQTINISSWDTHFANADLVNGVDMPLNYFKYTLNTLFKEYPILKAPLSTSNSAATLSVKEAHYDAVRSGIMMYGCSPFNINNPHQTAKALNLNPAMGLYSQIISLQSLKVGDSVGYGSVFTAQKPMTIGIVACGYADGYPRHAPTGTPIAVNGVLTQTVGRVSMDMLAVDLSPIEHAMIGSPVELWGGIVSADSVADACGTIAYELLCALAQRVPVKVV